MDTRDATAMEGEPVDPYEELEARLDSAQEKLDSLRGAVGREDWGQARNRLRSLFGSTGAISQWIGRCEEEDVLSLFEPEDGAEP